jgi:hypothetical protein
MSDANSGRKLRVREALDLLNARPGWEVSPSQMYRMVKDGTVPAVRVHGAHNRSYRVIQGELEKWAAEVEQGNDNGRATL